MTLSSQLISSLYDLIRSGLPENVRRKAADHVADTVAISFAAARRSKEARAVVRALANGHGSGACAVIGLPNKLPAVSSAFANAALSHALDFDDVHDSARLHPTGITFSAALSVSKNGKNPLLEAVALGNELMCRLGSMVQPTGKPPTSNWFLTQLFGYFGAAFSAGHVLGLTRGELQSAIGLAYMQLAGAKEAAAGTGSTARSIYPGFAAAGGVQAALLAQAGIVGPSSALDGPTSAFRSYLGFQPNDTQSATLLSSEWIWLDTMIKPWPSCRLSHPYVAAGIEIHTKTVGRSIDRIVIEVDSSAAKLSFPLAERCRPTTVQDATYSIPYMTAFAIAHGRMDLDCVNDALLTDQPTAKLLSKVEIVETGEDRTGTAPGTVSVQAGDVTIAAVGDVRSGQTLSERHRKFLSCMRDCKNDRAVERTWALLQDAANFQMASILESLPQNEEITADDF